MLEFPRQRLTVNLAPAELRKQGSGLDLPIAVAVALAVMRKAAPPRSAFLGELALDGTVCHVDDAHGLESGQHLAMLRKERVAPLWSTDVGAGINSAPVISDGRVFVTDTAGTLHAYGLS